MKRVLLATAIVAVSATVAHADNFAGYYGNTVNITNPDGSKATAYVNPDKTWERKNPDGSVVKGTYTWKDGTTACLTQVSPAPAKPEAATTCVQVDAHKPGDSWSTKLPDGKELKYSITQGR